MTHPPHPLIGRPRGARRVLVLGDFIGAGSAPPVPDRRPVEVCRARFNDAIRALGPRVDLEVACEQPWSVGALIRPVTLTFASLDDFAPDALLASLPWLRPLVEARRVLEACDSLRRDALIRIWHLVGEAVDRDGLALRQRLDGHDPTDRVALRLSDLLAKGEALRAISASLMDACRAAAESAEDAPPREEAHIEWIVAALFVVRALPDRTWHRENKCVEHTPMALLIIAINTSLAERLNEVLHHPAFQRVEAAWRSLHLLVDRADRRDDVRVELLQLSKDELRLDLARAPDAARTALHRIACEVADRAEHVEPYDLLVGDYEFTNGDDDLALLDGVAAVASEARAPFLTGVAPAAFGLDSWEELSGIEDLKAHFAGPRYARWRTLRRSERGRHLALCLPRFLVRLPYDASPAPSPTSFFQEDVVHHHERYLWGNAAVALAAYSIRSSPTVDESDRVRDDAMRGVLDDLPVHRFEAMGEADTVGPVACVVPGSRASTLLEAGFIALTLPWQAICFCETAR